MATKTRNRYYNPNPKKLETSDCVVRALVKATGKEWDDVYRELCDIGFEMKELPNADNVWKAFVERHGFERRKIVVKKGDKRPTPNTFAAKHKEGTFVLQVANHIVTCVDGYYYDTWDCGHKGMYTYWEKVKDDE